MAIWCRLFRAYYVASCVLILNALEKIHRTYSEVWSKAKYINVNIDRLLSYEVICTIEFDN